MKSRRMRKSPKTLSILQMKVKIRMESLKKMKRERRTLMMRKTQIKMLSWVHNQKFRKSLLSWQVTL
jgi:hypothetical protein